MLHTGRAIRGANCRDGRHQADDNIDPDLQRFAPAAFSEAPQTLQSLHWRAGEIWRNNADHRGDLKTGHSTGTIKRQSLPRLCGGWRLPPALREAPAAISEASGNLLSTAAEATCPCLRKYIDSPRWVSSSPIWGRRTTGSVRRPDVAV